LIVAKAILPRFGGAPSVWTTCMLFFQALLLAGYAYAHALARGLAPRVQAALHLALLAVALLGLPLAPGAPAGAAPPSAIGAPVLEILGLLARSVALPAFLLCAGPPLLQSWSARASGASPYRLYALSNAGSMLGLLAYPFAIEPWLATR